MEELNRRYGDRVQFLNVYVREAHPSDGWGTPDAVKQPRTSEERADVANICRGALKMKMPLLLDDLDDHVGHLYSGMPDRLYIIDRKGKVAYKGGRGPFGFKPAEMEQSLVMLLLGEATPARNDAFLPIPSDAEAWKHLPSATRGAGQPLPAWARILAKPMPATTAAMLELDHLHRARSPLDAVLRGKIRWMAADANGCRYSRLRAEADLRQAGVSEAAIRELPKDAAANDRERKALQFARKLTAAAYTVTDAEVAELIAAFGEEQTVAMVLLLAHANFQDRLFLSLGLPPEAAFAPPLDVRFDQAEAAKTLAPQRKFAADPKLAAESSEEPEWKSVAFGVLQKKLDLQRDRPGRIRVPTWDEVAKRLPPAPDRRPLAIKWSLVCMGYQPELADGWSACTRAFRREADQDRVFEESLFWVVTRTLQCFY